MSDYRVIEVKQSVLASNEQKADELRSKMKEKGTLLINLMSSPGSGKTTTLRRTIKALKGKLDIAVMEADIDSDVDAAAISEVGAQTIQLHTGGMCHLDAAMCAQGLEGLAAGDADVIFWKMWATLCVLRNLIREQALMSPFYLFPKGTINRLSIPLCIRFVIWCL